MKGFIIGLLLLLCNGGLAAADSFPPPFTANYKIYAKGFPAGNGTRTLTQLSNGNFLFKTTAKTSGFISLFKNLQIEEQSRFIQKRGKIRPLQYIYRQTGKKTRLNKVIFDWANRQANSIFKEQSKKVVLREGMLDRLLYQVVLMQDLQQGKRQLSYTVVTKGKIVIYAPKLLGTDRVETGVGNLKTLKYTRRSSNNKRHTTLWCAPSLHYLPVMIEHVETNGDVFKMVLQSVKGLK